MKYNVAANFDVIIIGSGISGLICAIELARQGKTVFIATKEAVTESSSLYAQGGMAVPLSNIDSFENHYEDTLKVGTELCDLDVVKKIISYSQTAFNKLVDCGVKFDLNEDKSIHQTMEAAHTFPRVVHVGGDASGRFVTKVLIDNACREPNISISQGTVALQIMKEENSVSGVLFEDVARNRYVVSCSHIIIATGGIGQLYKNTTNPLVSTGDGIVMAYDAGAALQDLEMIQFHPTGYLGQESFLITEAIRGEGAKLKSIKGEYFASKYHPDADLAPRDILARAIHSEIKKTSSSSVLLDVSMFDEAYFKQRFPTIHQSCMERDIDLFNVGIPVAPAMHYCIGGIKTDVSGKTNVEGLWAVGECASTGFHGANRLASNSLLECIAVPLFLVEGIMAEEFKSKKNYNEVEVPGVDFNEKDLSNILDELKERNWASLGLFREELSLKTHLEWLKVMSERFMVDKLSTTYKSQELKNMLKLSTLICKSAINRKNSLGVHYREDYPNNPSKIEHSTLVKENMKEELVKP